MIVSMKLTLFWALKKKVILYPIPVRSYGRLKEPQKWAKTAKSS